MNKLYLSGPNAFYNDSKIISTALISSTGRRHCVYRSLSPSKQILTRAGPLETSKITTISRSYILLCNLVTVSHYFRAASHPCLPRTTYKYNKQWQLHQEVLSSLQDAITALARKGIKRYRYSNMLHIGWFRDSFTHNEIDTDYGALCRSG